MWQCGSVAQISIAHSSDNSVPSRVTVVSDKVEQEVAFVFACLRSLESCRVHIFAKMRTLSALRAATTHLRL